MVYACLIRNARFRILALVGCFAAVAAAPVADGGRRAVPPTVYWLGRSFEGLPLVAKPKFPPSFIYERCGPTSRARCEIQVQNWLLRGNHPSLYAPDLRASCIRTVVRGAPAAFFGDHLDVYTGWRSVRIFAGSRNQALRAALALRSARRFGPPAEPLRPPAIGVARALRPCRTLAAPLTG